MNKKWVTIGVIGVLVLGGGYYGYKRLTAKPAAATNITAKAKMGDISKVITATGTVNYPHAIPLSFQTTTSSSTIVELNVKAGDTVKAGQVLAKMDDTKMSTSVLQAQASVITAQAKLQTLQDSFNDQSRAQAQGSLAKAQQGVASAQQNLTTAQQNADTGYLTNQVLLANQAVKQASDALAKAQQSGTTSSIQPAQSTLDKALNDLTTAQNLQSGGAAQTLASAQAQLRSAQADVVSAQYQVSQQAQGPQAADLQSAQASIDIAQAQLASAQSDLKNTVIIAPVDAVVVSSPLQLGQQTDAKSIITITPSGDKLEVDASIDQSTITQVKVGQKVDITLDAYPNQHISGTVSLVALQGTIVSNVTTFTVTAMVDQVTDLLRAGMNANVNIIVAEAKNVLTVPSEAVKTRGTRTGVTVPMTASAGTGTANSSGQANTRPNSAANAGNGTTANGGTGTTATGAAAPTGQFIPVEIGLDDGTNVEIKSGLNEGQEVIIGTRSSTTAKASSGFSLGGGGGGANPARALGGSGGGGAARGN